MKADTILRSSIKTISSVHDGHHSSFRVEWNIDGEGRENPPVTWSVFDWNTAGALADGLEKAAKYLRDLIEDKDDEEIWGDGDAPEKVWVDEVPDTWTYKVADAEFEEARIAATREFLAVMGKLLGAKP